MKELKSAILIILVFLGCYFLPIGTHRFDNAIMESFYLVRWYAREHVLLCLIPAFFIAGAIGVFVSQTSVMKYLGAGAHRVTAYGVAAVSGSILAVCSCTVLPLFAGIYRMGAGLGPACAFLYAGPAVNVLAIILTARILGMDMGIARAVGAILFSVVLGMLMQVICREKDDARLTAAPVTADQASRPLWKTASLLAGMIGILVFANWARSGDIRAAFLCCPNGLTTYRVSGTILDKDVEGYRIMDNQGVIRQVPKDLMLSMVPMSSGSVQNRIHASKWLLTGVLMLFVVFMVARWLSRNEMMEWGGSAWGFTKQILPLLLAGVWIAGLLLGRPGHEGLIPQSWVDTAVGGNSFSANFLASLSGAFMYFATLTEVPIVLGLMENGMGKGPALALLLAGPALSLPNMLVIRSVMGTKKTMVFISLVIVMATFSGWVFGHWQ